ncbi:MAG: 4-(cytidine 5'-diphospho)-2-C-methyl-D-erythritol kinase [Cyclobacteriaceae bacterium]
MVSFPSCKINLGLNIISKRPDGYHNITTCFYPVQWNDVLDIVPAKSFSFSQSGIPVSGAAADNLCVRAYEILKKIYGLKPVAIHLHKIIPIGAGLGGGSSDGAYTLRTLNGIFDLALSGEKLKEYAAQLGSDCAFFIENKAMIGTGRGEILSDVAVSLKGKYLVIVKPEVHISTARAFAGITPRNRTTDLRQILEHHPIGEWKELLGNDFEAVLFKQFPLVEALHQKMYALGASYASLTGSGSAVFGIFKNEVDLKKEFDSLVYWCGFLD